MMCATGQAKRIALAQSNEHVRMPSLEPFLAAGHSGHDAECQSSLALNALLWVIMQLSRDAC